MWMWNRKKENTPNGFMTATFLLFVFILRFFYEFLKENQVAFESQMNFNMGQWLSIPVVVFAIGILVFAFKNRKKSI
jgi:prolipoprotein diacylglyceryltransferase